MSHLIQLKQKIRSIKATKKITHAVRLVSMSLYAKLERSNKRLEYYSEKVHGLFYNITQSSPEWSSPVFFPEDILDATPLHIIAATSKGLCGGLNTNLFRYFEHSAFVEEQQEASFVAIGSKAIKFLGKRSDQNILCSYKELNFNNYTSIADDLVTKIVGRVPVFSSVTFYGNHLKSFFIQVPQKSTLIPLTQPKELDENDSIKNVLESLLLWEQDINTTLNYLSRQYLYSSILYLLFQALITEQAARFVAMDNSTSNAEKFLESLTLEYNKYRQSLITQEVSELSTSIAEV